MTDDWELCPVVAKTAVKHTDETDLLSERSYSRGKIRGPSRTVLEAN